MEEMGFGQRLVAALMVFGLLGSPVGAIIFYFVFLVWSLSVSGLADVVEIVMSGLMLLPLMMVLSYVIGLLPALVVGVVAAFLNKRLHSFRQRLMLAVFAAFMTTVLSNVLISSSRGLTNWSFSYMLGAELAAFGSTLVMSLLYARMLRA